MLVVVRHGRTAVNASGRLLGRSDPGLDEVGEAQAAAAAAALAGLLAPVRVIASPLARARATAAAIAAEHGVPVEVDERWIELDYGALEGTPLSEVPPDVWAQWRADPSFVPAGGESLLDVAERVAGACDELARGAGPDGVGDIVVVSHVSPVKAALCWALGVGMEASWRSFVAPGSLTRIALRNPPQLLSFNESPPPARHIGA